MAAACAGAPTAATERPAEQWAEVALDDLHFIRATLRENHPGPLDETNPAFRDWYVSGFDEALALARKADSYAGYFFAIQRYMKGFQDGHLGALYDDRLDPKLKLQRRWPGFVLGLEGDEFRVVETAPGGPPAGATLESCDGRSTKALVEEIVEPYFKLWSVRGARARSAPFLLIDEGNPFVRRPEQCRFRSGAQARDYRLQWTPIDAAALAPKVALAQGRTDPGIGIRRFGQNGWWISLGSFDVNDDSTSTALLEVIKTLEARPQEFRDADTVVVDVRGNTGGSSSFGHRIASAIWGSDFVATLPKPMGVDWRVSAANIRMVAEKNLPRLQQRFGEKDERTHSYAALAAALQAALLRGDEIYSQEFEQAAAAPAAPVGAKVFLLTDGWCGSACLDFADVVLSAPGVTHVGAETSADTIYIDNTAAPLPSGEGLIGWSMKAYRGRPRGHNETYVPEHAWTGSMDDTPGLERWIASLARSQ